MVILYQTKDTNLQYRLEFFSKQTFKNYLYPGKSYPIATQCVLYKNGLIIAFSTIIKHVKDNHNPGYAVKESAKNVMSKIPYKDIREIIWQKLFDKITQPNFKL